MPTMIERFPYSRWHDPSSCDHCSDNGFVETGAWRVARDLAARADAETRRADEDPIDSGLAAVRYEGIFGHRPGNGPSN
jgi:hypothetical protein